MIHNDTKIHFRIMASWRIIQMFVLWGVFFYFKAAFCLLQQHPSWSSEFHVGGKPVSVPDLTVQLQVQENQIVLDNGILQVTLSSPDGHIKGIKYGGIDNLLEVRNKEFDRGYWDVVWSGEGVTRKKGNLDRMEGTDMKIIMQNEEQIEVSFTRTWNSSLFGHVVPLNFDKRFVMLSNSSGFYTYAIYEHLKDWPKFDLDNTRVVFKTRKDKFRYMAIADDRQRYMPLPEDRKPGRGQVLAYPEAVLLVNPIEPEFKGEVDDKYEYACESKDNRVHGWICNDPPVGFWQITPSFEFRSGGPLKQYLTSHVGPTTLAVLHSTHYAGLDMIMHFGSDEPWKKVYGPVFVYLNSLPSSGGDPLSLWEDAKKQMVNEVQSWPYDFPASEDFPKKDQRGCVTGKLLVFDRFVSTGNVCADGAYVGLAVPGDTGSWQTESKVACSLASQSQYEQFLDTPDNGYQFWTNADKDGVFTINNIRTGVYNLNAWVPGFIGDYKYNPVINITAGCAIDVGELVYEPPRNGSTLWEIGYPDRSAAEFYVPDPNPNYINKLYLDRYRYRQYGLWERYADLYPDEDLTYTIGDSNYTNDWFFVHVTRKRNNNTYEGTTWRIKFQLDQTNNLSGTYTLRLALATANVAELQVRINDPNSDPPLFTTGEIGHDNTIARHGIHGLYRLYSVDIEGDQMVRGNNTIYLRMDGNITSPFQGFMYDYIRLECPLTSSNSSTVWRS